MNLSNTLRCTRIRLRAQQSCPALSNTPYGAVAAAFSRSQSAKMTLALLPPSSSVTAFDLVGGSGHHLGADLGRAGEDDLADVGVADEPLSDHRALAGQHLEKTLGQAGLHGQLAEPYRGQRRPLGRLEHHRVAGGQRRREAPGRDRHREVPRRDHTDHAHRFVEGDVQPAGHGNLPAGQPFRGSRIELQHVAHVTGLPLGAADRMPGVGDLQGGQLIDVGVDRGGEGPQRRGPFSRRRSGPGLLRDLGPRDGVVDPRGVGQLDACAATCSVAGLISSVAVTGSLSLSHTPAPPRTSPANSRRSSRRLLGMPLHRQNEVVAGHFDGLDHTVVVRRADHQPVAEPVDGLVVVALRIRALPDQPGQPAAGRRSASSTW